MPLLSLNEGLMKLSQVLLQMGKHIHPIEEGIEEERRGEKKGSTQIEEGKNIEKRTTEELKERKKKRHQQSILLSLF